MSTELDVLVAELNVRKEATRPTSQQIESALDRVVKEHATMFTESGYDRTGWVKEWYETDGLYFVNAYNRTEHECKGYWGVPVTVEYQPCGDNPAWWLIAVGLGIGRI